MPLVNGLHCATPRSCWLLHVYPNLLFHVIGPSLPFVSLFFFSMIVFHLIKFFSPLSFLFVLLVLD